MLYGLNSKNIAFIVKDKLSGFSFLLFNQWPEVNLGGEPIFSSFPSGDFTSRNLLLAIKKAALYEIL